MRRAVISVVLLLAAGATAAAVDAPNADAEQKGAAYFFSGDLESAAASWEKARAGTSDPYLTALLADTYGALGRRALAHGDRRRAAAFFRKALALAPRNPDWPRLSALASSQARPSPTDLDDGKERDRLYTSLLLKELSSQASSQTANAAAPTPAKRGPMTKEAPPASPAPRRRPAVAHVEAKARAVPHGGGSEPASYEEGLRLYYRGDYQGALEAFEEASSLYPSDRRARRALQVAATTLRHEDSRRRYAEGLRDYYAGRFEEATEKFLLAVELDGGNAPARKALNRIRKAGDPTREARPAAAPGGAGS